MRFIIFFLMNIQCLLMAASLDRKNIPDFNSQASHVIYFAIQKDFSDGSLKADFLKRLKSFFGVEIFVETGTYLGNTTAKAAEIFTNVHTIELFPGFYSSAVERFKRIEHVHLHYGDSGSVLPRVLALCDQKTLIYLDGHYDGGEESGKGEKNTPILQELAAIKSWGRTDSVILIDDICDFQRSLYPDRIYQTCFADYPDLKKLVEKILEINPCYQICFMPNALLIFPPTNNVAVSSLLRACTIDWFSVVTSLFSEQELLEAEKIIGSIGGAERAELKAYFQAYAQFERKFGWPSFASLWMGLILLHQESPSRANLIFKLAAQSSLPGWRVDRYVSPVR